MRDRKSNCSGNMPLRTALSEAYDAACAFAKVVEPHPRVKLAQIDACSRALPQLTSDETFVDVELSNGDLLAFCVESSRHEGDWIVESCVGLIRDVKGSTWEA